MCQSHRRFEQVQSGLGGNSGFGLCLGMESLEQVSVTWDWVGFAVDARLGSPGQGWETHFHASILLGELLLA